MKTKPLNRLPALFLASVLAGMTTPALRAQMVVWPIQNFDGNICGMNSLSPVALAYDPTQDNTGDGGGSCHITTGYSQSGTFVVTANDVSCCFCALEVVLQLSNYTSVEFDVKWDNSSTVPLSYFNTNYGGSTAGITVGIGPPDGYTISSICYSNVIIPDAATNGWVHISAPINHAGTNSGFSGLVFEKIFPAYSAPGSAAFWLDNLKIVGPTLINPPTQASGAGGNFTLNFPAIQGATYTVLKSTDLVHWSNLVTGYPPGGAAPTGSYSYTNLSFTDTNANGGQGFYCIRRP
jgi:hypothetical protein